MKSLDRYLFRQLFTGFVLVALALVCVLWLTQSLRFVEMIVNRGLGIGMFIYFTALLLPNFLTIILPVALFAVIVFVYARLNMDRELPVMRACGMSNWTIAKPAMILTFLIMVASYTLNLYLVPKSYELFRNLQWDLRHSLSHLLLREGTFNDLGKSVTVYVRERTQEGQLLGILVHDESDRTRPMTLIAKRGALVEVEGSARVIMFEGNRQVIDSETGKLSMLYFDRYTHDIPIKRDEVGERTPEPRELMVPALLHPEDNPLIGIHDYGKHKVEGHQRLISPFLCLSYAIIAVTFLTAGQFSRRGQASRIMGAILCIVLLQILSLGIANIAAKNLSLLPLLYILTLLPIPISAYFLSFHKKRSLKQVLREIEMAKLGYKDGGQA
jgi:lipopolysaccharide export system permease protein